MSRRLLTYADVAEQLGCSVRAIRRHVSDGTLPVIRIGHRTRRVRPDDLDRFLLERLDWRVTAGVPTRPTTVLLAPHERLWD